MSLFNSIPAALHSYRLVYDFCFHGLESVLLLIARYTAFKALYVQKGSTIQAELQRRLTNLYARILTFLAYGI
ncbi:uncharacterized protein N7458_003988 [Penicillium daleae]|uniref:Uncharacterized protein n=1 Tax=Penicillium daleae TaxID=63821 RepID=A0AAD6G469_9EURO|nr:uncharacterized protein N7458_003988 [Penicillium daleae]KAJ5455724.1 hypothetical protein N7458_003988 [Penicillium daleae]